MKSLFSGVRILLLCGGLLALFLPTTTRASGLEFTFDNVFSGADPVGVSPWAKARIEDSSAGSVLLTFSAWNLTSSEKVTELYLNITQDSLVESLQFSTFSGPAAQLSLGQNAFKADGDGKYDILLRFSQVPNTAFSAGDTFSCVISGIPGLTASSFETMSMPAGGHGPFYSAIHIQGIDAASVLDTAATSGWVSPTSTNLQVPEPGSATLALVAVGLSLWGRKSRKG
jgi:hypothetical protein